MNLSIDLRSVRVLAIVARRGNHYDAGVNQHASRATNRIVFIRAHGRSAQTHVDDANVVFGFVQGVARAHRHGRIYRSQNPAQGTQQTYGCAGPMRIQHTQINDVGAGSNALVRIAVFCTQTGGRRSHVAAVTKGIIRRVILAREVLVKLDSAAGKRRMSIVNTRVDHGDADAGAIESGVAQTEQATA